MSKCYYCCNINRGHFYRVYTVTAAKHNEYGSYLDYLFLKRDKSTWLCLPFYHLLDLTLRVFNLQIQELPGRHPHMLCHKEADRTEDEPRGSRLSCIFVCYVFDPVGHGRDCRVCGTSAYFSPAPLSCFCLIAALDLPYSKVYGLFWSVLVKYTACLLLP